MSQHESDCYTLAILNVRCDYEIDRAHFLVEQGGDTPLQKIKAAAIAVAEADRSWEVYDGPFTWGDFICSDMEEVLAEHGVERMALATPFESVAISSVTEISVEASGVLVENSRKAEPGRFEFEPYCACGLAAVVLRWVVDGKADSMVLFFLSDPEHKGKVKEVLEEAAAEYLRDMELGGFGVELCWDALLSIVPERYLDRVGLKQVTPNNGQLESSFKELDPDIMWIETVTLDANSPAVTI